MALPAALPSVKPMDAHSAWVPNGDGREVGILPGLLGDQSDARGGVGHLAQQSRRVDRSPSRTACSPRSPARTGQRWPEPWFWPGSADAAHGLPWTVQVVGSPVLQSPYPSSVPGGWCHTGRSRCRSAWSRLTTWSTTASELAMSGSVAGRMPRRVYSRKPGR